MAYSASGYSDIRRYDTAGRDDAIKADHACRGCTDALGQEFSNVGLHAGIFGMSDNAAADISGKYTGNSATISK